MNGITKNIPAFERGVHALTLLLQAFGEAEAAKDARTHVDIQKIIMVRRENSKAGGKAPPRRHRINVRC